MSNDVVVLDGAMEPEQLHAAVGGGLLHGFRDLVSQVFRQAVQVADEDGPPLDGRGSGHGGVRFGPPPQLTSLEVQRVDSPVVSASGH